MRYIGNLLLFLYCTALLPAQESDFIPFPMIWPEQKGPDVDMSFLLEKPAGKDGFIRIQDGHFVGGRNERIRFWGVNVTAAATVPPKDQAAPLATHLARHGINCVRFHFLDLPAPQGILRSDHPDTREFDPEYLDRLDYFVHQLKLRGIYSNLNLNVGRRYKPGDGVREADLLGFAKGLTYFDPVLLELQRDYAARLLKHRNPYTGNEYRSEPAVALVEFVNENSIVESWFAGRLLGEHNTPNPGTWTDIPESYEKQLTALYNTWLREKRSESEIAQIRQEADVAASEPVPRLRPDQFSTADRLRFHTEAHFYMELEAKYFEEMSRFLKTELEVKALLVGTSDHNHWRSGYPLLSSASKLDVVDGHTYWQHPSYREGRLDGHSNFEIPNTAMVDDPAHSAPIELSRSAVAGKPFTVSEVNHPFPNRYASEGIPVLAAYALLQDWDGIFWYTFEHKPPEGWNGRIEGHFDLHPDPLKMSQLAAAAPMFHRQDVRPARRVVPRGYSAREIIESIRLDPSERPYFTPGFPRLLPLIHGSRIVSFSEDSRPVEKIEKVSEIVSDTGELTWTTGQPSSGVVRILTGKTEGLVGFLEGSYLNRHLGARMQSRFSALLLTSLDGQDIIDSSSLLLSAAGSVRNQGMQRTLEGRSLSSWGQSPAEIEVLRGEIVLAGLDVENVRVFALTADGHTRSEVPVRRQQGTWVFQLEDQPTAWYRIEVVR